MTTVQTIGLTKRFGAATALEPLDLTINPGTFVSLVGRNGSGKSTLLRLLAGRLDPSAGRVQIGGNTPDHVLARAARSFIADSPTFYDDLSVRDHLEYVARLHGVDEWEPHARLLCETLGIADRLDDRPVTFSRGLRQKAALAVGFVRPFSVLLVDEPFVGLDAVGRAALVRMLSEAHAAGATVVVATHELSFVERTQRLLVMRDGALTYDGDPTLETAREATD